MVEVLTNLFKDSSSLKKNFLARRWGPEKASFSIALVFILDKVPQNLKAVALNVLLQVCQQGEGAICFVTKP